ncbi:hypothetical protein GW17_00034199 [Ensete ventricosum]|nr:hypothetical protein GW17_00034199 [Ensete ventricosum]
MRCDADSSSGPRILPGHQEPFLRRTQTIVPTLQSTPFPPPSPSSENPILSLPTRPQPRSRKPERSPRTRYHRGRDRGTVAGQWSRRIATAGEGPHRSDQSMTSVRLESDGRTDVSGFVTSAASAVVSVDCPQ